MASKVLANGKRVLVGSKADPDSPLYSGGGGSGGSKDIPKSGSPTIPNSTGDQFLSAIQNKLLEQTGIISSTNSQLETKLNEAISGIQESADASAKAITSKYDREIDFQSGQALLGAQTHLENRTGFATQMVAFRNLVETTDKSLKDLEMRKQELLLQNDSEAASKISDLQFKALEFQQQAQQQTFSNLLGIANFGLQSAQEQRLAKAQTFTEKKAISDIALQYGLKIDSNDTLDTMTAKAMVFASEEQKARLAKLNSEVKYNNAQTAKILKGDGNDVKITPEITDKLATRWQELYDEGFRVETSKEMENILGKYAKSGTESDFYDAVGKIASEKAKSQRESQLQKEIELGKKSGEKAEKTSKTLKELFGISENMFGFNF